MSNSTTLLDTIAANQANKEVVVNALLDAASPAMLWGRHASACGGLTWGYYGGNYQVGATAHAIANGTLTLTASTTNFVQASATTGAVSVNTTGFAAGAIPLYSIVTGTTTVSSYTDARSYQPSATVGGGGTVSSVALAAPAAEFTVTGSPVTGSGTLTLTKVAQAIHTVWAGPSSGGSAAPGFRVLVGADLPVFVASGASHAAGAVPDPGATAGTAKFLREDSTWQLPAGSGALSGLTDVNVTEGSGINQNPLVWDQPTGFWVPKPLTLSAPVVTGTAGTWSAALVSSNLTLSNGNRTATSNSTGGNALGAPLLTGKMYFEFKLAGTMDPSGGVGFALNTAGTAFARGSAGVYHVGFDADIYPGTATAQIYNGGTSPVASNVICVALDLVNHLMWARVGAGVWNAGGTANPATGVGGIAVVSSALYVPYTYIDNTGQNVVLNMGDQVAFAFTPPSGFSGVILEAASVAPTDVSVTSPADGDLLRWNATAAQWQNTPLIPTSNRNGFVDGAFDSWQAGTSFAVPAGTTVYAPDMWQCNVGTGGAATISQQAYALGQNLANSPIAPKFFMRYALTTASSVGGTIGQRLEGMRSYAGQSVTVSFNLKAAAALTLTQIAIVQFPGSGGSPTAAIITNKTIAWVLGTTEARYSVRLDIPAISPAITMGTNGDDALVIRFILPTGITFTLDIGQAQIEPCRADAPSSITGNGGSPTSFDHRGYQLELDRVHRFVFKLIDTTITATGAISVGQLVTTGAGAVLLHFVSLPTNMRVLPTLNFVVGAATNLFFGAPVSAAVATLVVSAAASNNMLALSGTVSTTAVAVGLCCQLRANTTATLLLADARF